jgi:hypothetical protein
MVLKVIDDFKERKGNKNDVRYKQSSVKLGFNKLDGTSTFCLSYPKFVITKKDTNLIKNQVMFFFCSLLTRMLKSI